MLGEPEGVSGALVAGHAVHRSAAELEEMAHHPSSQPAEDDPLSEVHWGSPSCCPDHQRIWAPMLKALTAARQMAVPGTPAMRALAVVDLRAALAVLDTEAER